MKNAKGSIWYYYKPGDKYTTIIVKDNENNKTTDYTVEGCVWEEPFKNMMDKLKEKYPDFYRVEMKY